MTREEAIERFNAKMPKSGACVDVAVYTRWAVQAMVEVMAEAIAEKTEPKGKTSSEMTPEEWDEWWKKSGELFL